MRKKNIDEFNKFFRIAFVRSKINLDQNMIMLDDLKQECYLVYYRMKDSTNDKTYQSYAINRLIGAIRDYRRYVLKSRNKINYVIHIKSLEKPIFSVSKKHHKISSSDDMNLTIGDTISAENQESNIEAERIANFVMTDSIFNNREREFFDYYFIQDINSPGIAKLWNCSEAAVSLWKSKVEKKLRRIFNEKE